jgi:hemolysin activation/secretion protein
MTSPAKPARALAPLQRSSGAGIAAAAVLATTWAAQAQAQVVERNSPQAPPTTPPTIVAPNATPEGQDATPIGPALSAIVVLGPKDPAVQGPAAGVDVSRVQRLNTKAGAAVLQPFLGKPISRRLIAQIEAAVAQYYRDQGFPFVSLSTPEQEITGGVLQVRAVEFRLGMTRVTGVKRTPPDFVARRVGPASGDTIDSNQLSEDLRWLNLYPFRQTQAIFSPGSDLGTANLNLATTELKPWRVYGGYANSGSPSTGWDRGYLGFSAGLPHDAVLSYQFTASGDWWVNDGHAFSQPHPSYIGHGATFAMPTAPRQQIEAGFDAVETNEPIGPFDIRLNTMDLNLGYRFALSNFSRRLPGDVVVGVEGSRQQRLVQFIGIPLVQQEIQVYQAFLGWSVYRTDRLGTGSANVTLHVSPGGLGDFNSDAAFEDYTLGRMTSARYAYVDLQVNRTFRLPKRWAVTSSLFAQFAGSPLPDSQRIGLGGHALVRGYNLDDGAFDSGLVWRNELRAPSLSLLRGRWADELSPYAFVDASYGWVVGDRFEEHPVSAGLGADYALGRTIDAALSVGYAFTDAIETRVGDVRIQARVTIAY